MNFGCRPVPRWSGGPQADRSTLHPPLEILPRPLDPGVDMGGKVGQRHTARCLPALAKLHQRTRDRSGRDPLAEALRRHPEDIPGCKLRGDCRPRAVSGWQAHVGGEGKVFRVCHVVRPLHVPDRPMLPRKRGAQAGGFPRWRHGELQQSGSRIRRCGRLRAASPWGSRLWAFVGGCNEHALPRPGPRRRPRR